jgi:hypothetical protein
MAKSREIRVTTFAHSFPNIEYVSKGLGCVAGLLIPSFKCKWRVHLFCCVLHVCVRICIHTLPNRRMHDEFLGIIRDQTASIIYEFLKLGVLGGGQQDYVLRCLHVDMQQWCTNNGIAKYSPRKHLAVGRKMLLTLS